VARLDLARDAVEVLRLAPPLVAMRLHPEAPAVGVAPAVVTGDEGGDEDEAMPVGGGAQAPVGEHVVVGLAAAVQRHHHRRGA